MMIKSGYKKLIVWQKSMKLAESLYCLTKDFPKEKIYGLTSQMRRAAVSVCSNIAEGSKRQTIPDFKRFLAIALGSVAELETQVEISKNLNFGNKQNYKKAELMCDEVAGILTSMIIKKQWSNQSTKV